MNWFPDVAGRARWQLRASGRGARRSSWPARRSLPRLLESFGLPGFRYSPLGSARRHSGADAGRAGCARHGPPRIRAASAGRACWPRRGATASIRARPSRSALPRRAALPRSCTSSAPAAAGVREAGWPPRPCCATPASSSTTRGTTGTRSTWSPARRSTATRRCSARWSRPSRATWARAVPQPGDRALRNIPAVEHSRVQPRGGVAAFGRGAEPGPRLLTYLRRRRSRLYPRAGSSGAAARGARARSWSCGRCARRPDYFSRGLRARALCARWRR
jgi:hypothetical protein